jgi:hypothetical protein
VFASGLMRPEDDFRSDALERLSQSRIDPNDVLRELERIAPAWAADHPDTASALRRIAAKRGR